MPLYWAESMSRSSKRFSWTAVAGALKAGKSHADRAGQIFLFDTGHQPDLYYLGTKQAWGLHTRAGHTLVNWRDNSELT
jgi:hypothetical protein